MDCQQWRSPHQSDEQQPAKLPKTVQYGTISASSVLGGEGMGSLFSMAQWQELELQALIYQYMMAEASVPLDLILSLKRSFVSSSPSYFYHHLRPSSERFLAAVDLLTSAVVQTGYWGRCLADPEPWRCRRTDGKKWRCSREVVPGHKYCERHVHRGRNRSRKHVEILSTDTGSTNGYKATTTLSPTKEKKETHFTQPDISPPQNIIPLNQRYLADKRVDGCLQVKGSNNPVLMRFFDGGPKTEQESERSSKNATPGNSSSDFCLKLSTGNGDWCGFENQGEVSTMGGPLAEALRSSNSLAAVLQKLNGSACSGTSCASG